MKLVAEIIQLEINTTDAICQAEGCDVSDLEPGPMSMVSAIASSLEDGTPRKKILEMLYAVQRMLAEDLLATYS